jgi:hypothetical protein
MEGRAIFKTQKFSTTHNITITTTAAAITPMCVLDILHFTTCGDEQPLYFIDEFLFESRLTGFVLRARTTMSVAVIRCCCGVSTVWTTK